MSYPCARYHPRPRLDALLSLSDSLFHPFSSHLLRATALCALLSLSAFSLNGCYSAMPLEEDSQNATNTTTGTTESDLAYDAATAAFINLEAAPATRLTFDYNSSKHLTNDNPLHSHASTATTAATAANGDSAPSSELTLSQVTALANKEQETDSNTASTFGYKSRWKPLQYNKYHPAPLHSVTPHPEKKPEAQDRPARYYHDSYYYYDPFYYDQPWRGLRGTYLSPHYYYGPRSGFGGGLYLNIH